jgi:hypothetical protein
MCVVRGPAISSAIQRKDCIGVEFRDLIDTTGGVVMDERQDSILKQLQDYGLKARLTSPERVGCMGDDRHTLHLRQLDRQGDDA